MTKEELRQYRSIKTEICQIERRIKDLEGMGGHSDVVKPLRDLYRQRLSALVDLQVRIERAIESLTSTERELLRLRYIDGADWTEVAAEIHYEWTQTHRIHARALAKIKDI